MIGAASLPSPSALALALTLPVAACSGSGDGVVESDPVAEGAAAGDGTGASPVAYFGVPRVAAPVTGGLDASPISALIGAPGFALPVQTSLAGLPARFGIDGGFFDLHLDGRRVGPGLGGALTADVVGGGNLAPVYRGFGYGPNVFDGLNVGYYDYTLFGDWAYVGAPGLLPGAPAVLDAGGFYGGVPTPAGSVPLTGVATYRGAAAGWELSGIGVGAESLSGSFAAVADFGAGVVTGTANLNNRGGFTEHVLRTGPMAIVVPLVRGFQIPR